MKSIEFKVSLTVEPQLRDGELNKYQDEKGRKTVVIVLAYWDWFGPEEELEELEKNVVAACHDTEGIDYYGRHGTMNRKYHWCSIFDAENMPKYWEYNAKLPPRDKSKMTHWVADLLGGNLKKE